MEPADLALLVGVAFATAVLSAVVGLAGGMILLAAMLVYLEPLVAIPLHGLVQLLSNGSRAWLQRRHVDWPVCGLYAIPLLPSAWAGLALARALPPRALRGVIGVFVLVATWAPGLLGLSVRRGAPRAPRARFLGVGALVGGLGPVVGATGPLAAPFFLNLGLSRQGVIGTQAACQTLGHAAKVAVFAAGGFGFAEHAGALGGLCAAVVLGSWAGTRLLDRLKESWFVWLYRGALTLLALRLVLQAWS